MTYAGTKWEYRVVAESVIDPTADLDPLSRLGEDGWELVTIRSTSGRNAMWLFKRARRSPPEEPVRGERRSASRLGRRPGSAARRRGYGGKTPRRRYSPAIGRT